jgi:hypothetical protein
MVNTFSTDLGALALIETVGEILFFVGLFSAFAMFFIVAIGNRSDADPTGSRPIAAYLFSGAFLFIWVAYFGIAAAAFSLINLIGSHATGPFTLPVSYDNEAIRACVLGGLLVVFAGGAGYLHLKKGNALADAEANPSGPTKRVMRSYVALVSFISILIVVPALIVTLWLVFGLISPTIFLASSSKTVTARGILDALVLVFLGGAIFTFHQRFAPVSLRTFSIGERAAPTHAAPEPPPSPPATT